jgi:uncharacterized delta-60 repeat protein
MFTMSLLKSDRSHTTSPKGQSRRRRTQTPRLETLEDRKLLSWGLDPTFNAAVTPGYVLSQFGASPTMFMDNYALALEPITQNGVTVNDILVSTRSGYVARYKPDGTLDTNFGTGGMTNLGLWVTKIAVDSKGNIVLAGGVYVQQGGLLPVVARLNPINGSLDTTFGSKGIVSFSPGGSKTAVDTINALTFDSQGRILVAGGGYDGKTHIPNFIARLTTKGGFDTSFGSSGFVWGQLPNTGIGPDQWQGLWVEPDNSIDVAGVSGGHPVIEHVDASGKNLTSVTQSLPAPYTPSNSVVGGGIFRTVSGQTKIVNAQTSNGPEVVTVFQNNSIQYTTNPVSGGGLDGSFGGTNYYSTASGTPGVTTVNMSNYFTDNAGSYTGLTLGDKYQGRFYVFAGLQNGSNAVAFDSSTSTKQLRRINLTRPNRCSQA